MRVVAFLLFATGSRAQTITAASLEENCRSFHINVDGAPTRFAAQEGKFWDHLIVTADGKRAFVVLQRGSRTGGWFHEDVQEFSAPDLAASGTTYKLRSIPLVTTLEEASIDDVYSASDDGSRLLVSIHYCYARDGERRSYRRHPYFFDTRTGAITIVAP